MDDVTRTIRLTGFDPDGEPEIRVMSDGGLLVVFEFMPPSFVPDERRQDESGLGPFKDFDKEMQTAIGTEVVWEDREVFLIPNPKSDTVERIRQFLEKRGKR